MRLLPVLLGLGLTSAGVVDRPERNVSRRNLELIREGMTLAAVEQILGKTDLSDRGGDVTIVQVGDDKTVLTGILRRWNGDGVRIGVSFDWKGTVRERWIEQGAW